MSYYNNSSSITVQNLSKYFDTNFNIELLNQQQYESITFENLEFDSFTIDTQTIDKNIYFKNVSINKLIINKSTFNGKFYINEENKENKNQTALDIKSISIKYTNFKDNFKLHNFGIGNIEIYQCNFYKNADFYKSKFDLKCTCSEKNIKFSRLNFKGLALFSDTVFHKFTIFEHVTIKGFCHFRNAEFKNGLDLTYVNFEKAVNFFGVKGLEAKESIKNTPQETYRLIKHNLKQMSKIIEANKFHSLELESYNESLVKSNYIITVYDLIVLTIHKITSDYSRNWPLVLIWIMTISFYTDIYINNRLTENYINLEFLIIVLPVIFFIFIVHKLRKYLLFISAAYIIVVILLYNFTTFINLETLFKYMSIFTTKDEFTKNCKISYPLFFVNKIILGYLYYQFLITIRKNTNPL